MNFLTRRSSAALKTLVGLVALALPFLAFAQNVPVKTNRTNPVVQDGTTLNAQRGDGQSIALPLASIGKAVGWKIPADDYRINVPVAAGGRETSIEVFSPEINRNDYANARDRLTYYGDELYGKTATLQTEFKLSNPKDNVLFSRKYSTGTEHGYEALFQGTLPAGIYPFRVASDGNGKNSFALRATNGLRVEASQFTVNARGQFNKDQLVAFVQVDKSAVGKTIELANYDADGNKEIVLTLVAPDGRRFPLTASEDTKWASNKFKVDSSLLGNWKILAKLLPTTRQFSNSFAFRTRLDDKPIFAFLPGFTTTRPPVVPLKVDVVDTLGNPVPGSSYTVTGTGNNRVAQPVLPECWKPVTSTILVGQGTVNSNTMVTITSPSGHIRFVVDCPKAKVQVNAVMLVCGQRLPLVGTNFSLLGQTAQGKTPAVVEVNPGAATIVPAPLAGATAKNVVVMAVRGQTISVTLEYSLALGLTLSPSNLDLEIGEITEIMATATTPFAQDLPATISLEIPDGLEALGSVSATGTTRAGAPFELRLRVKATKPIVGGTIRASLEPNCGVVAVTPVQVRALTPAAPPARLTLTKGVDRDLVAPGDQAVFTVVVTNVGGTTAQNVNLTDILPLGLSGEDINQTFDLEPSQSRTVQIPSTVTASASGTIVNTARVTWSGDPLQASAQVRVEVVAAPPKLSLTKTVDQDLVKTNDRVNFTITVSNTGGSPAQDVRLTDALPTGLRGNNLDQRFDLAVGQVRTFRVPAIVVQTTAGVIVNTANLTWSGDPLKASAQVRLEPAPVVAPPTAVQPTLSLTKTVDRDVAKPNDRATFTVVVTNTSTVIARGVRLTDVLPRGLSGANLDQTMTLSPGQARTFRIPVVVTQPTAGVIVNTANVTWSGDPLEATAQIRVELPVVQPPVVQPPPLQLKPTLAITKTVDKDVVKPGDRATFLVTVSNTSTVMARDVQLTDVIPSGLSGTNLDQRFDLAAGQSRTFRIPTIVSQTTAGTIINTARVTWSGALLEASAQVRIEPPPVVVPPPVIIPPPVVQPTISLTKTVDKDLVRPTDRATFTIVVTNTSSVNATNLRLTDALPTGLSGTNLDQTFNLLAGQSRTFRVPTTVTQTTAGTIINTAQVTWSGSPLEASARVRVEVPDVVVVPQAIPQIDLQIEKRAVPTSVQIGNNATFLISVSNNGPDNATGVVVSDPLPEGLEFESVSSSQGEASFANGVITASLGSLARGRSATITVRVKASQVGEFTNVAAVSGLETESNYDNNRASANLEVLAVIDLMLTKSVNPSETLTNQTIEYTLRVNNQSAYQATNVVLTDPIPDGITFVSASSSQGTFRLENNQLIVNLGEIPADGNALVTIRASTTRVGTFKNTATVKALESETRLDNNSASATVVVTAPIAPIVRTDLAITKRVNAARLNLGESATYTIVVQNNGPQTATEVTMTDPIPDGLEYIAATSSQGTVRFAGNTVSAALGQLEVGASATITVRVSTKRAGVFKNTASTAGKETETRVDNNSASAELEVIIPNGFISVTASSLSCATRSPIVGSAFSLGGVRYTTPARIELPIGEYALQPENLSDSSSQAVRVVVSANQTSNAELVYSVVSRLTLEPQNLILTAGQNGTVRAIASTEFPYAIAASIALNLPSQLVANGPLTSSGTIRQGQTLVLSVPVRALRPVNTAAITANLEPNCNVAATSQLEVRAAPLPDQRRESQVVLLARLGERPTVGSSLILSDRIPVGSSYIVGSSSLVENPTFNTNTPTTAVGQAISDPFVSGDRLFWIVPTNSTNVYGITYRLAHTGALTMPEDRVAAILGIPNSLSAGTSRNAQIDLNSPLGKLVGQGTWRVLQGDPSILGLLGTAVQASATSSIRPVGSAATTIRITALRTTTDATDQPSIRIEAFDLNGLPANDEFVTIETNADPSDADAVPGLPGFQVRLVNGLGTLRLQSLTSRALGSIPLEDLKLEARVVNSNGVISSSQNFRISDFSVNAGNPIAPNTTPVSATERPVVAVGLASAQVRYDFGTGSFTADGGLRFFLRGSVFAGSTFTIGINWQANYDPAQPTPFRLSGELMPPANPYYYLPLLGDSSILGTDVRSTEGIYARFETANSFIMYGQFNPQFQGILSNYQSTYNGFQGAIRTGGFSINAFAADAPNSNKNVALPANGTDLYFLPDNNINQNSESLVVSVYSSSNPTVRISRTALQRNIDYSIDYETGIIRLTKAITSRDANLNTQVIEASYGTSTIGRDFRFGAQAALGSPEFNVTATAIQFTNGTFGNNSGILLAGGLNIAAGGFQFGAELGYSGIFGDPTQSNIGLGAQLNWTIGSGFQLRARYQDLLPGYYDPERIAPASAGRSLTAGLTLGDPNGLRFNANLDHNQNYSSNTGSTSLSGEARLGLGNGWSAGIGLQYRLGFPADFSELFGTAGIEANLGFARLSLLQRVPLLGIPLSYGDTEASLEVPLGATFSILLKDKLTYEWNGIRQQLSFGIKGSFSNAEILRTVIGNSAFVPSAFGSTNVAATYDLNTTDGNAGRARLGIDTTIPLGNNLATQLGGEVVLEPNGTTTGSASLGLLFTDSGFKGLARAQFGFAPSGIRQVYTAGIIAQLGDEFVISPKIEFATDPSKAGEQTGTEFSVAAAYRTDDLSILTNHRAKLGFYSLTDDYVEGEVQFGYQANERLFVRLGFQYRNEIPTGVFTGLASGGFTWFVTDVIGVGAQGGYYFQPITNFNAVGFGVEASLKLVDRLLFTLGYNVLGFNGALGGAFRPGLYFRLDWKIDERTFGW